MAATKLLKHPLAREALLFVGLAIAGVVLLPLGVFFVGDAVFGSYGGNGFGEFFEVLLRKLGRADRFAWLLVLSPYIVVQVLRIMAMGWRIAGSTSG